MDINGLTAVCRRLATLAAMTSVGSVCRDRTIRSPNITASAGFSSCAWAMRVPSGSVTSFSVSSLMSPLLTFLSSSSRSTVVPFRSAWHRMPSMVPFPSWRPPAWRAHRDGFPAIGQGNASQSGLEDRWEQMKRAYRPAERAIIRGLGKIDTSIDTSRGIARNHQSAKISRQVKHLKTWQKLWSGRWESNPRQ